MLGQTTLEIALKFLTKRAYSTEQLMKRLLEFGFIEQEINECINRLQGWGYLNDKEFGLRRLATLIARYKSRAFVENDLRVSGLNMDLIKELLAIHYPETLELEIAQKLICRKPNNRLKSETWGPGFLSRAGFSENTIHQCFPELSPT